MRTSRLAQQLAEEDAKRPPEPEPTPGNGQGSTAPEQPKGPRYEIHRPWYGRLLAKGCARCGGEPPGWVQRQIQTPQRFKRFLLWTVNLSPRFASMVSVVTSKRVSSDVQSERDAKCGACPGMVIQLRMRGANINERRFCGECLCPKWHGSRLDYKNKKARHRCPLKIHDGSDPNAAYRVYIRTKQEAAAGGTDADRNGRGD